MDNVLTNRVAAFLALVALAPCRLHGQNTKAEFWPELGIYTSYGPRLRIIFIDSFNQDQETKDREVTFAYYFDFAMKPVFRRDLRGEDDVFRKRFLSFRTGYQYTTSFISGDTSSEKIIVAEATFRFPLPGRLIILNRNRGEFRFPNDKPFFMRYRNRLWAEHDFRIGGFVFTPYVYDEIYYDTSKSAWVPNRYAAGVQIPVGNHFVVEPYYLRQTNRFDTPKYVNATGLTFNFYF